MTTQIPLTNGLIEFKGTLKSLSKDKKKNEEILLEPYTYIMQVPKKEIRSIIIDSINHWFKLPSETIQFIEDVTNMIFESIVLTDDMQDNSDLRRGIPTAHKIFGASRTFLSCHALLFFVLKKIMAMNNPKALDIYADEMLNHYRGQTREIYWQQTLTCPTMDEYTDMISENELKCWFKTLQNDRFYVYEETESGFVFIIRMMQAFSDCKKDFAKFTKLLALFWQFQNDYSNLQQKEYWNTKGFCDDITEGKFSIAIIHAANSGMPEGEVVLNIIRQKPKDINLKRHCIHLLEKIGSIAFAKQMMLDVEKQLREEIDRLGGNPLFHKALDTLIDWKSDETYADATSNGYD